MIKKIPSDSLGRNDLGWLQTGFHFSFADYYNPDRMQFGKIRVINDDVIQPGGGFPFHPHKNMEIITYVRKGAISHEDNQGNKGKTEAGDVQVMSAGTGVLHSEFNHENEKAQLYQIWILPKVDGVAPRWEQKKFPKIFVEGTLPLLVSGEKDRDDSLFIYQDAAIYGGRIKAGKSIKQTIRHQAYILVSDGSVIVDDQTLEIGDGAEVLGVSELSIQATSDAELLILDVPA